ncbi:helix-turn-helix domain-containing protein, partial [Vibrio parahaemolyticus]|uniref:helix-turn-helix domain-containing protein n=2 Tax=Vibrionaceae TaxID=641 RepID=UPI001C5DC679
IFHQLIEVKMNNKSTHFTGYKIATLRADKQLTLQETAQILDITSSYLSQIENGKKNPSKKVIQKATKLFGVNEEIFYEEPDVLEALREVTDKADIDELIHAFKIILNERS